MCSIKKVLLFEYITGGGLAEKPVPRQLFSEGMLMLEAVMQDFAELGFQLTVLCDSRFLTVLSEKYSRLKIRFIENPGNLSTVTKAMLEADAFLPVAPESDGILADLCRLAENSGVQLLNSCSATVELTSSKLGTIEFLGERGLPVVPTLKIADFRKNWPLPWVVKPDDGVDCEGTRLIGSAEKDSLLPWSDSDYLIQPYIEGRPISVSAVFFNAEAVVLAVNALQINVDQQGDFHLTGIEVNAVQEVTHALQELIKAVAIHLPGLRGYVGIDLVQTENEHLILEINPRLTTSYAAIRKATGINPVALILNSFHNKKLVTQLIETVYEAASIKLELA